MGEVPVSPPRRPPLAYTDDPDIAAQILQIWSDPLAFGEALGYAGDASGRKQFGEFHRRMLAHTESAPRTSTVVPRGHAKSTVITIIKTCHRLLRDPSARILIACAGLDLAKKLIGEIRDRLNGDLAIGDRFLPVRDIFPWLAIEGDRRRSGPTEAFNITGRAGRGREPSVFAASVESNLAGNHPTHAVIDDPANEQNSRTFARRQKVIEFIQQLEPLMYSPDSPIDHIGTPWAFQDVTHYLADHPGWTQFRFGVWDGVNPETGERDGSGPGPAGGWPLCPAFLAAEEVDDKEAALSKQFFAAQYLCEPIPAEEALFDDDLVLGATDPDLKLPDSPEILLWDPVARVEGTTGDRNGLVVVRVIPAGLLGLKGFEKDRNVFVPVLAHEVTGGADAAASWIENTLIPSRPLLKAIWVEKVAAQAILAPWLEERGRLQGVRIRGQQIPTKALAYRLQGLQTAMRKGYLILPASFPGRDILVRRLTEFPLGDTDDILAALALLGTHLERRGDLPGVRGTSEHRPSDKIWTEQLRPQNPPSGGWPS